MWDCIAGPWLGAPFDLGLEDQVQQVENGEKGEGTAARENGMSSSPGLKEPGEEG